MAQLIAMFLGLILICGVSLAFAQKDKVHIGESLGGTVIRKDPDPDPLHSQPGTAEMTGDLDMQMKTKAQKAREDRERAKKK